VVQRDRRIGVRVQIVPVAATWRPVETTTRRWPRRGARPQAVHLVEVSVTGGLVVAETRDAIEVGTLMVLEIASSHSVVEVRNIRTTEHGTMFAFGVLFVSLAPELQQRVYGAVGFHRDRNGGCSSDR
jgi:hypothetical protein